MHLARLPRDGVSEGDPKALEKSLFRCVRPGAAVELHVNSSNLACLCSSVLIILASYAAVHVHRSVMESSHWIV